MHEDDLADRAFKTELCRMERQDRRRVSFRLLGDMHYSRYTLKKVAIV